MRYNHHSMLPERAFHKVGGRMTLEGGSPPSAPPAAPTTSTTFTSNIPEYLAPYAQTMLGATQAQIFNMDPSGNVTGFKPYQPYSTDPSNYVAGFSPLQKQAQSSAANLQVPGQFGTASTLAGAGGVGTAGTAGQLAGYGQYAQQSLTNPYNIGAYMNPYVQNALAPQLNLLAQQTGIQGAQQQAAATQAGAFGGSRSALQNALVQQAGNLAAQQAIGQGYNTAYNQAQQAQQAALGMGLTGLQGAQSGYGQLGQLAATLGSLGGQQLSAEQGVIGTQAAQGATQQAQQQNIINQAIQNYATAQQYPYMQLGIMNSMLRGLPTQSTTTQSYQATPSTTQQAAGLGLTGAGILGALKGSKKGGLIKGLAAGGEAGQPADQVTNNVERQLDMMNDQQLQQVAGSSSSATVRAMAQEKLREHKIREQAEAQAQRAIAQQQAPKPQMPQPNMGLAAAPAPNMDNMAGGGIVAFADGGDAEEPAAPIGLAAITDPKMRAAAERYMETQRAFGYDPEASKQYKDFLAQQTAGLGGARDRAMYYNLAKFGANLATTPGPVGYAIGQSAAATLPGLEKDMAAVEAQKAALAKSGYDITSKEQEQAGKRAEGATKDYENVLQRETELQRARIAAGPGYAAANRETDTDKSVADWKAYLIANGADPKDPTLNAKARQLDAANKGLTGQKVENAQQALAMKDPRVKALADTLQTLETINSVSPDPARTKQIADTQQKLNDLIRTIGGGQQAAPAAPAAGGKKVVSFADLPTD